MDRNVVTLEDQIVLTVSVSGGRGAGNPKLPPLPDFQVSEAGTSSRTEIINGKFRSSREYNYVLVPRRTGTHTVGPVSVTARGRTTRSKPIQVRVLAAASDEEQLPDVFIRQEVDDENPFVHQQIVYVFRFFQRARAVEANWDPPSFQGFWVEDLGKERNYEIILEGQKYAVTEIKKALFPISEGRVEIPESLLVCKVVTRNRRSQRQGRGFEDHFFSTPFFGTGRGRTVTKNLHAKPIQITVRPLPGQGRPDEFSGLVGSFRMQASVGDMKLKTGDSTTLTVTVTGEGNLRDLVTLPPEEIPGFKIYPDKPSFELSTLGDRVDSTRVFKKALVPLEEGTLEVPGLEVSYFDPSKGEYQVARTAPIMLAVSKGEQSESAHLAGSPFLPGPRRRIQILGKDILPIHTGLVGAGSHAPAGGAMAPYLIAVLLPPCAFFITFFVKRRKERLEVDPHLVRKKEARKKANLELKEARRLMGRTEDREFYSRLARAVKGLIGDKLNLSTLAYTPAEVDRCLKGKGIKTGMIQSIHTLLEELEHCQYGSTEGDRKEREEKFNRARQFVSKLDKKL